MAETVRSTEDRSLREARQDERGKATAIWVVYLVGLFTALPFLIGVVLAYVFRGDAPDWLRSHYGKQIGLFWWGVVIWPIVGWLLTPLLGLGFVVLGINWLWMLLRCVQGLKRVNEGSEMG